MVFPGFMLTLILFPGDRGDPGGHAEGGGFPSDDSGAGPRRLVLRVQQPGRPRPPEDVDRRSGRAVVAAAGAPGGECSPHAVT